MTKTCTKCNIEKELTEFHKRKTSKVGYKPQCKSCRKEEMATRYKSNKEHILEKVRKWKANNREKHLQYNREYNLLKKYNLTMDDYNKILDSQKGCCAICGTQKLGYGHSRLCVDHCHTTGKIRGLLCNACNIALGKFEDKKQRLLNAIHYLEESDNG